jgi:hypothetical protein
MKYLSEIYKHSSLFIMCSMSLENLRIIILNIGNPCIFSFCNVSYLGIFFGHVQNSNIPRDEFHVINFQIWILLTDILVLCVRKNGIIVIKNF